MNNEAVTRKLCTPHHLMRSKPKDHQWVKGWNLELILWGNARTDAST